MRQVSDHVAELLNILTMSTTCGSSGNVSLLQNYNTAPVTGNFGDNTHLGMNSSYTSLNTGSISVHDYDSLATDMSLTYSPSRVTPLSQLYIPICWNMWWCPHFTSGTEAKEWH